MAYYIAQMKHSFNLQLTVHGLDFGIHAEMTVIVGVAGIVYNDERRNVGTIRKDVKL